MEHSVPTRGSDAFMHFGVRDASVARSGNMEVKDKKAPSVRIEALNRKKDLLFLFPISDMIIFVRNTVSTCYQLSTVHDRTQANINSASQRTHLNTVYRSLQIISS